MLTQQTVKTQVASAHFDALAFELKHAADHQKSQRPYIESDYEIDSDSDWCGSLYRVWKNSCLLGTFYQKQGKWISEPYYSNRKYQDLGRSFSRTWRSNELAIRYIITCFEGC